MSRRKPQGLQSSASAAHPGAPRSPETRFPPQGLLCKSSKDKAVQFLCDDERSVILPLLRWKLQTQLLLLPTPPPPCLRPPPCARPSPPPSRWGSPSSTPVCTRRSSWWSTCSCGFSTSTSTRDGATRASFCSSVCSGPPFAPRSSPSTSTTPWKPTAYPSWSSGCSTASPCVCSSSRLASSICISPRCYSKSESLTAQQCTEDCKCHPRPKLEYSLWRVMFWFSILILCVIPRWVVRCAYTAFSLIFLCVNVTCAVLGDRDGSNQTGKRTWKLVLVRVIVNDLLFIVNAVLLAAVLLILTRHSRSASPYMINKGTTVCQTAGLGAAVIILFATRACYNLTVLVLSKKYPVESFNYDWYNVSDQADLQSELGDRGYIAFGVVLFIWELLPTSLLILILRVRRPAQETSGMAVNNRILPRPYFFDDPQASDDDIPAPWDRESTQNSSWYGSETAPLLFANNPPDQSHQHHTFYSTPQN
uniref:G protein-coupled receptor 137 n=1 Tax=Kryptolebias marmoratus TaxID=37003 RepID=A0A3Q3AAX6_KRYMA